MLVKRYGNLITKEKITLDFCRSCIYKAAKGKRKKICVQKVLSNIDYYATKLQNMAFNNSFAPSPYYHESIKEGGKIRDICIPKFWPDQCMHHLLISSVYDIFIKRVDPYAMSSIEGKGQHMGYIKLRRVIEKNKYTNRVRYAFKGDIKKCFDSLKSEIAYREIAAFIKDKLWLSIFRRILQVHPTLPIGIYLSSWVLNIIMKQFDYRIRSIGKSNPKKKNLVQFYLRYMDDILILSPNKRFLRKTILPAIIEELNKLELTLKPNWRIYNVEEHGIDMMGFRFYPNRTIARKHIFKKFRRNALKIIRKGELYVSLQTIRSYLSISGQFNYLCQGQFKKYIECIDRKTLVNRLRIDEGLKIKSTKREIKLDKCLLRSDRLFHREKWNSYPVPHNEQQRSLIKKLRLIEPKLILINGFYANIMSAREYDKLEKLKRISIDIISRVDNRDTSIPISKDQYYLAKDVLIILCELK